jgi:hypothetical protein
MHPASKFRPNCNEEAFHEMQLNIKAFFYKGRKDKEIFPLYFKKHYQNLEEKSEYLLRFEGKKKEMNV